MKLAELDNNTLIFSEKQAKVNLLLGLKAKKQIKKLYFSNGLNLFKEVKYNYPFFMYNKFNIKVDLAKRILKFLPYINIKKNYQDKKLAELKDIKNELIKASIYYDFDYNKFTKVVILDESIMPKFIKHYQKFNYFEKQAKSIKLIRSENQLEQVYAIYEKVVELLEESVAIDNIKIVNTLPEDNYQLQKIFTDANIPIYLNKTISITKYPFYKSFKKLFKTETLAQVKTYLLKNQAKQKELTTKIINCFNRYSDKQIENNKDIFLYELEKETIKEEKYLNTVEIIDIKDINVYSDNYYLFINYIDEIFPRKIIDNDYLTDKQKQQINFFTSEEINKYNLKYYSHLFNAIKNLVLFMPETVIDQTRKSRLNLDREIVEKKYTYKLNTKSYLHGLNYLRYGKLRYNYLNYNLESSDYYLLKNTFKENFKTFNPQFKGIKTETLTKLLDNYTITGAKLEALNLCPFQYFLTYLLKLGLDIDNHYLYFGNVIHKALENLVINPDYDYKSLVKNTDDFPKDIIYKNEIYQEILIDIIEYIYSEVNKLHQVSDYKKILTEQKFNFKLDKNDRFSIKGIIDKVMLDNKEKYFAIIDYKFSDKSFSLKEFNQGFKQQLPIYLFAYSNLSDFLPSGIFYRQTSKSREKVTKKSDNRLNGVYLDNLTQIKRFDPTGDNILGLKYTNSGIQKSSRALSETDFNQIKNQVKENIYLAASIIESGKFLIKPITSEEINNDSISCRYCEFANICYSKNKQIKGANNELY